MGRGEGVWEKMGGMRRGREELIPFMPLPGRFAGASSRIPLLTSALVPASFLSFFFD
jgi:hypothetical protein